MEQAADADGVTFRTGQWDSSAVGREQFVLRILGGAKAAQAEGASQEFSRQQAADQKHLRDKTDIGPYYAVTKGLSDVANAKAAMSMCTDTADSITTTVAAIDGYHTAASSADSGAFLMPLVGVVDSPFDMASMA